MSKDTYPRIYAVVSRIPRGRVATYEECFRVATTHVLVREATRASVLEAIREGRCYAAFEVDADASGFRFDPAPALLTLSYEAEMQRFFSDAAHDSGKTTNLFSVCTSPDLNPLRARTPNMAMTIAS